MKRPSFLITIGLTLFITSCTQESKEKFVSDNLKGYKAQKSQIETTEKSSPQFPSSDTNSNYVLETIQLEVGWGYEIYKDGSLLIRQKNIPAVQGVHTFETKEEAAKLGVYVLDKIKNGYFPPSVTVDEIDSLQIKY